MVSQVRSRDESKLLPGLTDSIDSWILRNVAMMLYATLVTRALHPRRVNLDRAPEALAKRVSIADFFNRFPQLHAILLAELERGLQDSLDDLPVRLARALSLSSSSTVPADPSDAQSSNLDSPLFAILMLFGLLQTRESTGTASGPQTGAALSAPFIPLVKACARSRVWKVIEACRPLACRSGRADIAASRSEAQQETPSRVLHLRVRLVGHVLIS